MRMTISGAVLALAASLAACGDRTPATGNETVQVPGPEPYQAQLEAMPEGQRNAVFIRAIMDAGQECQHVASSTSAGDMEGFPVWSVRCSDGRSYNVLIGNDGVAQIEPAGETAPAPEPIAEQPAE
jgi:hypothetical protein